MSVWLDKTGCRLDGGQRPFGRTTVLPKLQKFSWRSFLFESRVRTVMPCRPDGRTLAASNFHIETSRVRTWRMVGWSDARTSRPCWPASGCLDLNCDTCLMDESVWTWIHIIQTVEAIFPYLCFGKNSGGLIKHWGSSGRVAESTGRMQAGVVRSFSTQRKVQTGIHVVQTADALDS
jgi:hypothetical protein